MIEPAGGRPCGGGVAITAIIAAQHMICRLGAGQHARTGGMTTDAVARRALEHAIHMASFATHLTMFAGEIKAGGQVIKLTHKIGIGRGTGA